MKPSPFGWSAPTSTAEAVAALAATDGEGKVLAGGQSLVPILSMRLAAPRHLVDINRVTELDYVRVGEDAVTVGATARHATVEHDAAVSRALPLLPQALRLVAHPVIRNRGTVCGSLAHADPSAELTAVLALLGGHVTAASLRGRRTVPADEFFLAPLENALEPDELVTEATFPLPPEGTGTAFVEVARRHGDYALAGAAAAVRLDDDLRLRAARVALLAVAPTPLVVDLTPVLGSCTVATADWAAAGRHAAAVSEPESDIHASADYRRHLVGVLTARALQDASDSAMHAGERRGGAA